MEALAGVPAGAGFDVGGGAEAEEGIAEARPPVTGQVMLLLSAGSLGDPFVDAAAAVPPMMDGFLFWGTPAAASAAVSSGASSAFARRAWTLSMIEPSPREGRPGLDGVALGRRACFAARAAEYEGEGFGGARGGRRAAKSFKGRLSDDDGDSDRDDGMDTLGCDFAFAFAEYGTELLRCRWKAVVPCFSVPEPSDTSAEGIR